MKGFIKRLLFFSVSLGFLANFAIAQSSFDYSVSTNPSSGTLMSVAAGSPIAIAVSLNLTNGTAQPVAFSCYGMPPDASCSFSPSSCSPPCNSTMTILTSNTTPSPYTYNYIVINSSGDGRVHGIWYYSLYVYPPPPPPFDYSVSSNPSTGTVLQVTAGNSTSVTVTLTLTNGSTAPVSLIKCYNLQSGATCSFSPSSCSPPCNSTVTISTSSAMPSGIYSNLGFQIYGNGVQHDLGYYSLNVSSTVPPANNTPLAQCTLGSSITSGGCSCEYKNYYSGYCCGFGGGYYSLSSCVSNCGQGEIPSSPGCYCGRGTSSGPLLEYSGYCCWGSFSYTACAVEIQPCTDSDGGINALVKGSGSGNYIGSVTRAFTTIDDYCATSTQLNEAYCDSNGYLSTYGYFCPNGCNNGVCLSVTTIQTAAPPIVGGGGGGSPAPSSTSTTIKPVETTTTTLIQKIIVPIEEIVQPEVKPDLPVISVPHQVIQAVARIDSLSPKEEAVIEIKKEGMDVRKVSLQVDEDVKDVQVTIKKLADKPSDVGEPKTPAYSYLDIKATQSDKVSGAKVEFEVDKDWVEKNGGNEDDVRLNHYKDGKWDELPTKKVSETGKKARYESETKGFSVFVISIVIPVSAVPSEGAKAAPSVQAQEGGQGGSYLPILLVIVMALLALITYQTKTGKKLF